jgi:hypothetical protein
MSQAFAAVDLAVGRIIKLDSAGAAVLSTAATDNAVGVLRESVTSGFECSIFDEANPEGQVVAGATFVLADIGKPFVSDSQGRAVLLESISEEGSYRVIGYLAGIGATGGLVRCVINRGEAYLPAES